MHKLSVVLFWATISVTSLFAQEDGLRISKASDKIVIDGVMNEKSWRDADVARDFKQVFPFDSSYADAQTEVRMTYDDRFVYVFAVMHNLASRKYVTPSLRRDYAVQVTDGFSIVLDTYNDKTNGYYFGSTRLACSARDSLLMVGRPATISH